MAVPSIKGTAFESAAADLAALVESGRLSRSELETRLRAEDLEVLDEKILPGLWYPMATYSRVLELLGEIEGRGRTEYFVERGARAAERLLGSGIYRQADRAESMKERGGTDWREPVGKLMLTVGQTLYNFMRWSYQQSPGKDTGFTIELSEATDLPDPARYTVQGFIEFAARKIVEDPGLTVTSLRPSPDRVIYRCQSSR